MASTERYTPNEARLIEILKRGRRMSSKEIIRLHYHRRRRPRFARQSVVCVLNSLVAKVSRNREDFKILKSRRNGPHPIEYWISR
jgi:hypothetical protein